jgi:hypothetical protein
LSCSYGLIELLRKLAHAVRKLRFDGPQSLALFLERMIGALPQCTELGRC